MRKAIVCGLAAALCLGLPLAAAAVEPGHQPMSGEPEGGAPRVAAVGSGPGLRGRAVQASEVTVSLPPGTYIELVYWMRSQNRVWWYAKSGGREGWIPESEVDFNPPSHAVAPPAPVARAEPSVIAPAGRAGAPVYAPPRYVPAAPAPSPRYGAQVPATQTVGFHVGAAFELAGEFGGDDVATVFFEDGTTQDVSAGQGITGAVGAHFQPSKASPWDVRAMLGYKYVSANASNADIHISRWTLELVPSYGFAKDWWIGAGAVRHMNIKYDADGLGPNLDFDPANGATVQLGWKLFALKYTAIEYEDEFGNTYDASSVGAMVALRL